MVDPCVYASVSGAEVVTVYAEPAAWAAAKRQPRSKRAARHAVRIGGHRKHRGKESSRRKGEHPQHNSTHKSKSKGKSSSTPTPCEQEQETEHEKDGTPPEDTSMAQQQTDETAQTLQEEECPAGYVPVLVQQSNAESTVVVPTLGINNISVSKPCLRFCGAGGAPAPLMTEVQETFTITNATASLVQFAVRGTVERCSRFLLSFSPSEGLLQPHQAATVTAKLAASCTTTVRLDVRITATAKDTGLTQVCALAVHAKTAKSVRVDMQQVFVQPQTQQQLPDGKLYRGRWDGQDVAVKLLKLQERDESFKAKVMRLEPLRSPFVARFVGASFTPGRYAVLTEWVPHGSLYDAALKGRLSPCLKVKCLLDCARGLQYLHSANFHSIFLQPQYVLVASWKPDDSVNCKIAELADFGTGRRGSFDPDPKRKSVYVAPEVFRQSTHCRVAELAQSSMLLSPESDVYSFGMLAWFLCTHKEPFDCDTRSMAELVTCIIQGERPPLPAGSSPPLVQMVQRCWDNEPAQRPTLAQLVPFLEKVLASTSGVDQQEQEPVLPPPSVQSTAPQQQPQQEKQLLPPVRLAKRIAPQQKLQQRQAECACIVPKSSQTPPTAAAAAAAGAPMHFMPSIQNAVGRGGDSPQAVLLNSGTLPLNSTGYPVQNSPAMPCVTQMQTLQFDAVVTAPQVVPPPPLPQPQPNQTQEQTIAELQQQQEKLMRQLQRYELQLNAQKQMLEMMNSVSQPIGGPVLFMNGTAMVPMQMAPIMPLHPAMAPMAPMAPMAQGSPLMPLMPIMPAMASQARPQYKY